jgi:hypothetical protein
MPSSLDVVHARIDSVDWLCNDEYDTILPVNRSCGVPFVLCLQVPAIIKAIYD